VPLTTTVYLLKLFVGLSTLAEFAAWQKKKLDSRGQKRPRGSCTPDAAIQPSSS
jgi:hypothetical protein